MAYKQYKTKQVTESENKSSTSTSTKQTATYHFAGGGVYKPMSVTASSKEEAVQKWEKQRVKQ